MDRDRGERQTPRAAPNDRDDRRSAGEGALTGETDDREALPFDVEVERFPAWTRAASGLVVVLGALIAVGLVPMLAILPALVISSIGRRFSSSGEHVQAEADALTIGKRTLAAPEILDVWRDASAEGTAEARVIVGVDDHRGGADLVTLYFENAPQAKRFADTFRERPTVIAGHRPRPLDALASLRFVAIGAAFLGTGSWFGALALAYAGLGAVTLLRAKQVVVTADTIRVHSLLGSRSYSRADVGAVDVDAGVIELQGGAEIVLGRSAIRDASLAPPSWLEPARSRVLQRIARPRGD